MIFTIPEKTFSNTKYDLIFRIVPNEEYRGTSLKTCCDWKNMMRAEKTHFELEKCFELKCNDGKRTARRLRI